MECWLTWWIALSESTGTTKSIESPIYSPTIVTFATTLRLRTIAQRNACLCSCMLLLAPICRPLCKIKVQSDSCTLLVTAHRLVLQASYLGDDCFRRSYLAWRSSRAEVEKTQKHQPVAWASIQLRVRTVRTHSRTILVWHASSSLGGHACTPLVPVPVQTCQAGVCRSSC